ncbi:hypothetical protein FB451DRAFT_1368606 [Mycena latifolia]|nr:hypothetical protein FB451DRAFT_1368606 [Mycena latifolia]
MCPFPPRCQTRSGRFQWRQRRHIQAPLTSIIESIRAVTISPTQSHPFLSSPHPRTPRAPSPPSSCPPSLFHCQSSITALELSSSTTARFEELGQPTLDEDARGLEGGHIMMCARSLISSLAHCASFGKPILVSATSMPSPRNPRHIGCGPQMRGASSTSGDGDRLCSALRALRTWSDVRSCRVLPGGFAANVPPPKFPFRVSHLRRKVGNTNGPQSGLGVQILGLNSGNPSRFFAVFMPLVIKPPVASFPDQRDSQ